MARSSPQGTTLEIAAAPESSLAVDADSAWGIVALVRDGSELRTQSWKGQPGRQLRLPELAASVCWIVRHLPPQHPLGMDRRRRGLGALGHDGGEGDVEEAPRVRGRARSRASSAPAEQACQNRPRVSVTREAGSRAPGPPRGPGRETCGGGD